MKHTPPRSPENPQPDPKGSPQEKHVQQLLGLLVFAVAIGMVATQLLGSASTDRVIPYSEFQARVAAG